ncbi:hypothetical protein LIA77_04696 [Sarocladium implicatum]|nr:hypothetical protein LIA77_04696 [Sarocladium implicatum]
MLQNRPSPNTTMMQQTQGHPSHQLMGGVSQTPRAVYGGVTNHGGYRGSSGPVQPYAFTTTPSLHQVAQWQPYGTYRTNTAPAAAMSQQFDNNMNFRGRFPGNQPQSGYMSPVGIGPGASRDDSVIPSPRNAAPQPRPQSAHLSSSTQHAYTAVQNGKAAPDRYRRPGVQAVHHGRSQSSTALPAMSGPNSPTLNANRPTSFYATVPGTSKDDSHIYQQQNSEEAKRMRRRSVHALEQSMDFNKSFEIAPLGEGLTAPRSPDQDSKNLRVVPTHGRNASSESVNSSRSSHSRPSSANTRHASNPTGNPSLLSSDDAATKQDQPRLVNIPARGSSSDATKRTLNPSPLSRPVTMGNDGSGPRPVSPSVNSNLDTPAAKQLAALNQAGGGKTKSKTSRLRRALSFGSAAELRRAAAGEPETPIVDKTEPSRLHKNPTPEEAYDAEQARIAEQQEAAGIGNSIYGGRFFGGSTDNLSISSTASSASIMIRKMGRGMKKSTRSLVGLFRPKSVVGVPAAEALAPEASQAAVSMITVEAETQRVNVNPDPASSNGGTDFPHLERNSIDAAAVPEMVSERAGSSGTDSSAARKSIVGGDRERAEVLAAVRKGILKRSTSPASKTASPNVDLELPSVPAVTDSPNSSAPSTPNDEAQGHRRTGSIAIGNEDYFMTALRLRQDTKSAPVTPQGGTKRNATFSPRIVFHDTWPSQEYDRRGEIATCNRLTPMLAQQIKEELNTFKMEMEVHENSKIYTHFF